MAKSYYDILAETKTRKVSLRFTLRNARFYSYWLQ